MQWNIQLHYAQRWAIFAFSHARGRHAQHHQYPKKNVFMESFQIPLVFTSFSPAFMFFLCPLCLLASFSLRPNLCWTIRTLTLNNKQHFCIRHHFYFQLLLLLTSHSLCLSLSAVSQTTNVDFQSYFGHYIHCNSKDQKHLCWVW